MRGDGSLYLRGSTWWCCYYLRGKQFRESTGSTNKKTAAKFLKVRTLEVGADQLGARTFTTPKASKLTVAELVGALRADFELRQKASPPNCSVLRRVEADFGDVLAVALQSEKIDKYIEERLADSDAPATINRTTQMLSQAYELAIRRGHLARAPYIRHLSEAGNARKGFIDPPEFEKVAAALPADVRDFCRFAYITGMRKSEIASLEWSDVEGSAITLRGENAKNGEARTIPLWGELAEIIERRKSARQLKENGGVRMVEFIFHRDGKPVAEFRKSWKTATKAAGVAGTLFHDMRRSAVRNLVQAGTPQAVAMKISGHKTASMFQRYNIVSTDDLQKALEKTEAYRQTAAKQKVIAMR